MFSRSLRLFAIILTLTLSTSALSCVLCGFVKIGICPQRIVSNVGPRDVAIVVAAFVAVRFFLEPTMPEEPVVRYTGAELRSMIGGGVPTTLTSQVEDLIADGERAREEQRLALRSAHLHAAVTARLLVFLQRNPGRAVTSEDSGEGPSDSDDDKRRK